MPNDGEAVRKLCDEAMQVVLDGMINGALPENLRKLCEEAEQDLLQEIRERGAQGLQGFVQAAGIGPDEYKVFLQKIKGIPEGKLRWEKRKAKVAAERSIREVVAARVMVKILEAKLKAGSAIPRNE